MRSAAPSTIAVCSSLPHFLGRLLRFPELFTEFVQFGNLQKEIG
jgi:hypothetical protein